MDTLTKLLDTLSTLKRAGDQAVARHDQLSDGFNDTGDLPALGRGLVEAHNALAEILHELRLQIEAAFPDRDGTN